MSDGNMFKFKEVEEAFEYSMNMDLPEGVEDTPYPPVEIDAPLAERESWFYLGGRERQFTLGDYIDLLERLGENKILKIGLYNMHTARGCDGDLAVTPALNVPVKAMLKEALSFVGKHCYGQSDSEFTATKDAPMHIDYMHQYGNQTSTLLLFNFLFGRQNECTEKTEDEPTHG